MREPDNLATGLAFALPQHPDQHRPERPVFLAVDQELGDNRVRPSVAAAGVD